MKENVSCASSGIHLLSIIETLGHNLEVLLSIFCGIKITLEWITPPPPPIFRSTPPLCLNHSLILKFVHPSYYSNLQGGGSNYVIWACIYIYIYIYEFRSGALTDWVIRSWVQLALRVNFIQLLQFYLFVQCSHFISVIAFVKYFLHIFMKKQQF